VNKALREAVDTANGADYIDCDDFKDEIVAWCVILRSELQQAYDSACCRFDSKGGGEAALAITEARQALRIVDERYTALHNAYSCPRAAIEARRLLQWELAAREDKA
jgi:hypothetical protein